MIEHPVITQTERWGYPIKPRNYKIICADCGAELAGEDLVFDWCGSLICESCCKASIEENISIRELAEAFDIFAKCAADLGVVGYGN